MIGVNSQRRSLAGHLRAVLHLAVLEKETQHEGVFMENAPSPPGGQIPPSEMLAYLQLEDREEQTSLVFMRQAGAPLLQNIPHTHQTSEAGKA